MLLPKFTINKNDRLFITDKYIASGHYLIVRARVPSGSRIERELLKIQHLPNGAYHEGFSGSRSDSLPDIELVIPKRDNYVSLGSSIPFGAVFMERSAVPEVKAYKYTYNTNDVIGVSVDYVPLLSLGHAFAKNSLAPIIILDSNSADSNLIALVMPFKVA